MKTGMLAAESAFATVHPSAGSQASGEAADLSSYETAFKTSWVYEDLHEVRNMRPSFNTKLGIWGGMMYSGIDSLFMKGSTPWTFRHSSTHLNVVCDQFDRLKSLNPTFLTGQHVFTRRGRDGSSILAPTNRLPCL
jgi:flavin-dependent dehydrogenase